MIKIDNIKLILFFTMLNSFFPILINNKFNILKTFDDIDHNQYIKKIDMNYSKLRELVENKFVYHYFQQDTHGEINDYIYIFYRNFFIVINSGYDYDKNKITQNYRVNSFDCLKTSSYKNYLTTYINHIENNFYKSVEFSNSTMDNLFIDIENIYKTMRSQSNNILQSKESIRNLINLINNNDLVVLFDIERMENSLSGEYTMIPDNLSKEEIRQFIINSNSKTL